MAVDFAKCTTDVLIYYGRSNSRWQCRKFLAAAGVVALPTAAP